MSVILSNNYLEQIGPKQYYKSYIPKSADPKSAVPKSAIPKTLKTKIQLSDTNLLFEHLSNNYLNFQLEYPDNLSTFIKSHTGIDLSNQIYNKFNFCHELISLIMSSCQIYRNWLEDLSKCSRQEKNCETFYSC